MPASSWAKAKAKARKVVHSTFRLSGVLRRKDTGVEIALSVRYHNKIAMMGDLMEAGYADVIDGVDRLIFDRNELTEKNIVLRADDTVKLVDDGFENIRLRLVAQEPINGPVEVKWQVARI